MVEALRIMKTTYGRTADVLDSKMPATHTDRKQCFCRVTTPNPHHAQVLYLHMRLNKPDMISGAVSYEQKYTVSSWASEEPVDDIACPDGCTSDCNVGGQCVELAQGIKTDRVIQCPSNEQ